MEALKEWATVIKALENGDQTVLLRKGGILETASGFKIESKKFFLFPTFEHQESAHIKTPFQKYLDQVKNQQPQNGTNIITSYAEVLDEVDISSEEVSQLTDFHILSDSYIQERINWKPEKPMKAMFLRVYKITEKKIPLKSEYQGCKSWININDEISDGESVLSDSEINSRLKKFKEIVN
ncbi:MAG TPA: DUF1802 family protein [Nitrosopumilaceae archaeon]|nr:DUF1802 family protein [Nitrosopumilaceae archaeon]